MKEHKGSRDLFDQVANWEDSSIPFSKTFGWTRFGLLGVLSDYVLNYTSGDIVEIGVCETSIFFTNLAYKHKRKVFHCDIQRSVIENCKTIDGYFKHDSVVFCGSSDKFFDEVAFTPIALGFIDGDHNYEQVKKDFWNLLPHVVKGGFIFLHDTYPKDEEWISENKCGTVYRLRKELEERKDLDVFTFTKSAWDVGLTIVKRREVREWE
jgi:hypothetical protein